ncbi:outer membrane beta barrel superfamily protein, DUF2490 [Erythrobacter litoralis]|uniref:DUF2490 domain-containing protein n=1 Tax=Erythrobacter litoralis TaxID=39960 RepID=A0A074MAT5_9SPHN|nr:DUF2490 domain-containing protein [Erythrobacter litoralis]AOL22766.1 outer membrane beta barrel superfamily protein, DUF2490 [Erythrobacter litoralis]KEO89870.1 hypothetical protein EH32_02470 [Erythrobacter litoralis]
MARPSFLPPAIALCAATLAASPAAATEDDFNIWTGQFIVIDVDEDGDWFVRGEAQERFTNDADRLGQLLLRMLVGYRLNEDVSIGGGYAYILTDPVGPVEVNEHRYYQELNMRLIDRDGITLDSRTRLEQRTFEEGEGTSWRLRNFVQLRVPISENTKFVAYTEPFIELNDTDFQRGGLSIWRNFAGVSIPLAKGIEVVPGYLNQTVFREGENRMDHVANVNVFMSF